MLITGFDAYLTPMSPGAVRLVHKSVNLKEPYNEDIKGKVTTKKFLKKKTGFTWNPIPQRHSAQKSFYKFNPLFVVLNFQIYINKPGLGQREGKWTWINLWNLFTVNFKENSQIYRVHITGKCICETLFPLYDLIISTHVKHPPPPPPHPINLPKKVCCAMQSFLRKKSPILWGVGRRYYALSTYLFPFLKVCGTNYGFQAKLPSQVNVFLKSYGMAMKCSRLF